MDLIVGPRILLVYKKNNFFWGVGLLFKKKVLKNIKGHKATWGGVVGSGNMHLMVKRDS